TQLARCPRSVSRLSEQVRRLWPGNLASESGIGLPVCVTSGPFFGGQAFSVNFRGDFSYCDRGGECAALRNNLTRRLTVCTCTLPTPCPRFHLLPCDCAFSRPVCRLEQLGHYSFVTGGQDTLIERGPGTNHRRRKRHFRYSQLFTHLGEQLPPSRQRLPQQAASRVIEQIEQHVSHGTPM